MGITRHYCHDLNFVLVRFAGEVDDMQLRQHMLAINEETRHNDSIKEIADCREVTSVASLSVKGTIEAVGLTVDQPRCRNGKLAILIPEDLVSLGLAKVFQSMSSSHRKDVEIFYDAASALTWLGYDGTQSGRLKDFMNTSRRS